ncbi:hypothetical protein [Streptomyces mexicanus]|uniref:hypothetical protein n=1 Tax=Streptomyces mexicanus TaxID=178566 RepID=UPI0036523E81
MRRGTAAGALLTLLLAALLALPLTLPLFAPAGSFAAAHTSGQAEATAGPATARTGAAPREERLSLREGGPAGAAAGPIRTRARDRHRLADRGPGIPVCPDAHARPAPGTAARWPGAGCAGASRPPADRTPAALQVFRC